MSAAVDTPRVAWLDPTEAAAWRGWLEMTEAARARVARDLQTECGLSEPDYAVLVQLSEHPDQRIRMSDLAAALRWSRSRLSHQVARMEARGQLVREDCDKDARGWYAVLTPSGLEDIRQAAPLHVASARRHFLDALDRSQMEQLAAISQTILAHLDRAPCAVAADLDAPSLDTRCVGEGDCAAS
jgi:DNA-binding MarR family transcriptional regulator